MAAKPIKTKFGIVALLDALGTRSSSIEVSRTYLRAVDHLRQEISEILDITLDDDPKRPKRKLQLSALRPRFFGDSILMTYEVPSEKAIDDFFSRIAFILNGLVIEAMRRGILFRGSVAIGKYLESADVVLGPAVVDAASWYEKLDQVGVICTPATTTHLKAAYVSTSGKKFSEERPSPWLILSDAPLNNGTTLNTYILNWPDMALDFHGDEMENPVAWIFDQLKKVPVLPGTEKKHLNTERFFKREIAFRQSREGREK